ETLAGEADEAGVLRRIHLRLERAQILVRELAGDRVQRLLLELDVEAVAGHAELLDLHRGEPVELGQVAVDLREKLLDLRPSRSRQGEDLLIARRLRDGE